jgi:amino acid transporter
VIFGNVRALFEECNSWILMVPASKRDHALCVHHALPERQCAFSPSAVLCTQLIYVFAMCFRNLTQESAACFSGEVKDPSRDYPLGMFLAILLVFITLFVPILIATGASDRPYSEWTDGYFVTLGEYRTRWLLWCLVGWCDSVGMCGCVCGGVETVEFSTEACSDVWWACGCT